MRHGGTPGEPWTRSSSMSLGASLEFKRYVEKPPTPPGKYAVDERRAVGGAVRGERRDRRPWRHKARAKPSRGAMISWGRHAGRASTARIRSPYAHGCPGVRERERSRLCPLTEHPNTSPAEPSGPS